MKPTLAALTVVCCLIVFVFSCNGNAAGQNGDRYPFRDTIPKGKIYTLTYDRNSLYNNLDSLNAIGSQYIGTELSKSSWMQIMGIYNRVLVRIVNSGKLDSVIIKK